MTLIDCRITNAVRCVPPENKPTPAEINDLPRFPQRHHRRNEDLRAILALGRIAHDSAVMALGEKKSARAVQARRRTRRSASFTLFSSYHCSRYNTNTGVLTPEMFAGVFRDIRAFLAR